MGLRCWLCRENKAGHHLTPRSFLCCMGRGTLAPFALEVLLRYIALPSARSAGLQKGPGLQRKPCTGFNQVLIIHAHVYYYFKSSLKTPRLGCLLNRTFSSPVTGEGGGKGSGLYPVLVWGPGGRWRPPALLSMLGEVAGMGTAPAHQGWAGDHGKCQ